MHFPGIAVVAFRAMRVESSGESGADQYNSSSEPRVAMRFLP